MKHKPDFDKFLSQTDHLSDDDRNNIAYWDIWLFLDSLVGEDDGISDALHDEMMIHLNKHTGVTDDT